MRHHRITVHCTATKNGENISRGTIEGWHKDRGFDEIGYHFIIQPDGLIETGRDIKKDGAHVLGANAGNIGIVLCGTDKFSQFQFNSLKSLLDTLIVVHGISKWQIYCHNQFESAIKQKKACPGFSINKLLTWYHAGDEDALKDHKLLRG